MTADDCGHDLKIKLCSNQLAQLTQSLSYAHITLLITAQMCAVIMANLSHTCHSWNNIDKCEKKNKNKDSILGFWHRVI